jgi:hypothetical protein
MTRQKLDRLLAAGGLVAAIVLLVAGGLLTWADKFVSDQVHSQLVAQKITFPAAGSDQLKDPAVAPYLTKYAGKQLTTGPQAKAFADHYIKVHLDEATGGLTYSELSAKARTAPDDQKLAGLVQTSFRGETLRGLLLNAYAFDTMGNLAGIASIVAYLGGALMVVLAGLGFYHAHRVGGTAPPAPASLETINA